WGRTHCHSHIPMPGRCTPEPVSSGSAGGAVGVSRPAGGTGEATPGAMASPAALGAVVPPSAAIRSLTPSPLHLRPETPALLSPPFRIGPASPASNGFVLCLKDPSKPHQCQTVRGDALRRPGLSHHLAQLGTHPLPGRSIVEKGH